MSRIKDMLAKVENIDDLEPVPCAGCIADEVYKKVVENADTIIEYIRKNPEFTTDIDDETGEECLMFENFFELCGEIGADYLNEYIMEEALDISDECYELARGIIQASIADKFADIEGEVVRDAEETSKDRYDAYIDRQS